MENEQEQTAPDVQETDAPEIEVEQSPEALWAAQRAEELGLVESSEESEESEAAPEEEGGDEVEAAPEEAEPEPKAEPYSKSARRLMEKEAKLRKERESFEKETSETREKLKAYEQSQAEALSDPLSHLSHIGLSEDDQMNLAREIYYKFMPDQASPAVRAEMAAIQRERRLQKLERDRKAPEPDEEAPAVNPAAQAYEHQYRSGLQNFAAAVEGDKFPLIAEYRKENFTDLVEGMFGAAVQAVKNGEVNGRDLTPEECAARVESYLQRNKAVFFPNMKEAAKQTEEKQPEQKSKAIRNKQAATRPTEQHDSNLSYEDLVKKSRENFYSKLNELDL